jgi:transketolase
MKGALRVCGLAKLKVLYVLTHDSIGLGEDGPTHQPVEMLPLLRSIPNLVLIRPGILFFKFS